MTRPVTAELLTVAAAGVTQPAYLVEIQWPTFSTRLCTFGTVEWNGSTWQGGGVEIGSMDSAGTPSQLTLADPDFAYRTLVLADGIRDRRVNIWLADMGALEAGDPVPLFAGFADRADIGSGRVTVTLDRLTSRRQFTPRERIGPAIGVNFVAPPGLVVTWGRTKITLESR
jgi:hypothetical protein